MTTRIYTGIGSRRTPALVLATMTRIARYLASLGYTLRSGGASGADSAFAAGAGSAKEIYGPLPNYQPADGFMDVPFECWPPARAIARRIHPAWNRCNWMAQQLHTRNVFEVSGADLDAPSAFVVYWAPEDADGAPIGGTRTAVLYARELGVPTFNLLHGKDRLWTHLRQSGANAPQYPSRDTHENSEGNTNY